MKDLDAHPRTPDFDTWPIVFSPHQVSVTQGALVVTWSDGAISQYHPLLLAETIRPPTPCIRCRAKPCCRHWICPHSIWAT